MHTLSVTHNLNHSADTPWALIASGTGLDLWFSEMIKACDLEGEGVNARRTITLADGRQLTETITEINADTMVFSYRIDAHPFPLLKVEGSMFVTKISESECSVTWEGRFDANPECVDPMKETMTGFYTAGLTSFAHYLDLQTQKA